PQPQPQPQIAAVTVAPAPEKDAIVESKEPAPAAQDMPPPWEDLPPEALESEPAYDSSEPPVWNDAPVDAEPSVVASAPVVLRKPVVQEASAELVTTPLGDIWHAIVTQLDEAQAISALVRELAMQSELVAQDGGVWSLRVQRTSLNQTMPRERLLKALTGIAACTSLHVENGSVSDTPALRNKAHAEARQKQAEAIVMNDPHVQHLQQTLGATIVPGSIRPV
ncbi:MAG TPA: DNA polymerase III subunit gamma/tau C-terminal domain-containing protein, partial [Comamonas sp.]